MTAVWIALEGGEGSGKSTQAGLLAHTLDAVLTREPGGTPVGSRLRELLLEPGSPAVHARTEALLMAADRAEHLASVVLPALEGGRHVVSDRSVWSSLAYQGIARGLGVEDIRRISDWAMQGRWPDLAVLVDVPADEADARLARTGRAPDRMEAEGVTFHALVRAGFAELARAAPDHWLVIDGRGPQSEVAVAVAAGVKERLGLP